MHSVFSAFIKSIVGPVRIVRNTADRFSTVRANGTGDHPRKGIQSVHPDDQHRDDGYLDKLRHGVHRVVHLPGPGQDELFHSDRLDPGQSFSYTFTKPGRYGYADPQYAGGRTSSVIVT